MKYTSASAAFQMIMLLTSSGIADILITGADAVFYGISPDHTLFRKRLKITVNRTFSNRCIIIFQILQNILCRNMPAAGIHQTFQY